MSTPANTNFPLPQEQQAIGNKCFHPSGKFIEFPKEDVETSIPARFEKIARLYPERMAVKSEGQAVTFTQLNAMANGIAHRLLAARGERPELIGLSLDKSIFFVAAMLGVLKAGKFFVIIDPALPRLGRAAALRDLHARLLMVESNDFSAAEDTEPGGCAVVRLDPAAVRARQDDVRLAIAPSATACLFYTAGSTGQPKAVVQTHRNLLHYQLLRASTDGLQLEDRYGHLTAATSNAISHVLFCALNGVSLLLYDMKRNGLAHLAAWLAQERVTICNIGAPLFRQLCPTLTGREDFSNLRLLRLGSDTVYRSDVLLHRTHFPPTCELSVGYSTSETGGLTEYRCDHEHDCPDGELPVGRVFEDKQILLRDDEDRRVGSDTIGEIVVRSRYLSPGYWNQPELTAKKFKVDADDPESRLYFTGDLGLVLPDGCLIHKGRKDFRVKIRGYGVDLSEVEKHLRSHPRVNDAAVVALTDDHGENRLVAYFTADKKSIPNSTELRGHLMQFLSDYMIPATFCYLDALPITPDGKTDRKALPVPQPGRPSLQQDYLAPQTPTERQLAEIWAALFKLDKVGIDDNFFDLGGHSLLAGELVLQMRRKLQTDLPLSVLFEAPTIAQLASRLSSSHDGLLPIKPQRRARSLTIEVQKGSGVKQIFCFPYIGGTHNEFFHFAELARHFGPEYSFYGLRVPGLDEPITAPARRVEEMAALWLEEIHKLQPVGPYRLLGECLGGVAAYETARQLTSLGEPVALLAFLDTKAWSWGDYLRHWFLASGGHRLNDSWTWNYAFTRTKFHVGVLRRLNFSQGFHYLVDKTSKAAAVIPYGLRREKPANRQEPDREADPVRAMQIKRVEHAYFQAFWRYRLRPYSGRITLLVNENAYALNPSLGWEKLAACGLDIHKLPGDHDACVPENIPLVARILMECLDNAKRNA